MEFTIAAYPSNPPRSSIAAHKNKDLYFISSSLSDIRASQKYTGLGKLCSMIREMITELSAVIGICDYALFQHKRFKNKYENSP